MVPDRGEMTSDRGEMVPDRGEMVPDRGEMVPDREKWFQTCPGSKYPVSLSLWYNPPQILT
jgi:hypothetical protein